VKIRNLPATAEVGSNGVAGTGVDKIIEFSKKEPDGNWKESRVSDLWDGRGSDRIVRIIAADLHG
jgi:hypothetical protein